jgi:alginate O-acetyltransferase complex protein AlgI
LIFIGLFFKVVIADNVATKVDFLFENWATNSMIQTWQAAMLFSVQIYGDFNGYTLTAIGLACMLGFTLPENFNAPYGAIGFTDFWRRWHISLSSWIRDYLYIPLGGSRKGKVRTYANLLISMALCGLWHGASFMFLLWGGIHGLFLCIERLLRSTMDFEIKRPFIRQAFSLAAIILTYLAVCFAWIPFRARTFEQCITMMRTMILGNSHSSGSSLSMWPIIIIIFGSHLISRKFDIIGEIERRKPLIFMCILSIFLSLFYFSGTKSEFIYFQF